MEIFVIDQDSQLNCIAASTFPGGVLAAHQALHKIIPSSTDRKYYGISWGGPNGTIVYKAAAEILPGENFTDPALESFTLKKGRYIFIDINNYMKDLPAIGQAFQELLKNPGIDPQGECVEWYVSQQDVKCLVRLKDF